MGGRQTGADLMRGLQSLVRWQTTYAAQQRRQVLTVDVLHSEKMLPAHLTDVVYATDIRVRNLASVTDLSMKSCESRGIVLQRGRKKLECYNIAQLEILSAINFAHAAAAKQSDDPIPLDKNSARRESSALRWVRSNGNRRISGSNARWLQGRRVGNGNGAPAGSTQTGILRTNSPAAGAGNHADGLYRKARRDSEALRVEYAGLSQVDPE